MKDEHSHSPIGAAFLLNFAFMVLEFAGGFYTNSVAIYSNALHDLGDSVTLAIAYGLERFSQRKGGETFTYGYQRFSLLSALVSGVILIMGSVFILSEAIPRLMHPAYVNVKGMVWLAVIGVGVNGIAAMRLKTGETMNAKMLRCHILQDVLTWAAILIISLILLFREIHFLDPLVSIGITLYILGKVYVNLRETLIVFLQGKPAGVDLVSVEAMIRKFHGIRHVHDMHLWSLDGHQHVLTAHIVLAKGTPEGMQFEIKCAIKQQLSAHGNLHATLEMENEDEVCDISH